MLYKSFRIQNYKGIRDTTIEIPVGQSRAVTFIGLNESGKTTLLEAIYSFSPDRESQPLFVDDALLPDETSKIPRDKLFSFSDEISVTATVEFLPAEKAKIISKINKLIGGELNPASLPDSFTIKDWQRYKNSVKTENGVTWDTQRLQVRTGRQVNWRPKSQTESTQIWSTLRAALPSIAYFPTFLSQVPNRIYLQGHADDKTNTFYRTIFQDILHQIGPDYSIKSQILDRLETEEEGLVAQVIAAFWGSPKRGMVQQLIDKASTVLSKVITDRWNEIFKTRPAGREIAIHFGLDENEEDSEIDPYIEFAIRDGSNRFNIADRSLGFRWFFCFLLFTQFRAKRQGGNGTLFLFDEPASNLHAKAQEKLLDSFKEVSEAPNTLVYSTHSPYMIDPIWLDNAYVIENTLISDELKDISEMSISEESDIGALKYKSYVDKFPDRINHFQPILDRLEVRPSIGEVSEKSLLVEGKSDYAIMRGLMEGQKPGFKVIPAHGATTLGALVGLLRGWGWNFAVMLDSDEEGKKAATKYTEEFALDSELFKIGDADASLKEIEDLLSDKDRTTIANHLAVKSKLTKKQIYQFFVQNANTVKKFKLDASGSAKFKSVIDIIKSRIG
jgi:predicted ATP-dependent endonuclease of OLD family